MLAGGTNDFHTPPAPLEEWLSDVIDFLNHVRLTSLLIRSIWTTARGSSDYTLIYTYVYIDAGASTDIVYDSTHSNMLLPLLLNVTFQLQPDCT